MNELRDRKMQERAHRIALRIHAERKSGVAAQYPSADAMCPPVAAGQWKVPEPSKAAMEHMASFGYVEEPVEAPTVSAQTVTPARTPQPEPTLAQQIAAGVRAALASMGIGPQPTQPATAPPRNEDK